MSNGNTLSKQILFPPGRVVQGSLYKAQDKDANGQPRIYPPGHAKAGQPKISYFFAVATPKNGEAAWWETAWGRDCLAIGQQAWPQGQWQQGSFAWKIEDGDSQVPNKRGRKNASTEGMPGHWIINFSSSFAPKICDERGQPLLQPDLVKPGYWVEVLGTVKSNETASNPGIYMNHDHVAFRGVAKEIYQGVDPSTVGFGRSSLPPGVGIPQPGATMPSAVAVPGQPMMPGQMPAMQPAMPGVPSAQVPGMPAMPGVPGAAMQPAMPQAAQPMPVVPHQGFLQPPGTPGAMPGVPAMPSAPAMPQAAPVAVVCPLGAPMGYKMANLNGPRYEAFRAQGWQDVQLMQAGHMVRL